MGSSSSSSSSSSGRGSSDRRSSAKGTETSPEGSQFAALPFEGARRGASTCSLSISD